ncbi:pickpocket protein 11-like [Spodoptera litura]|uniref:Pickpocket protein 11-like n=1 Tax=Spodoptera litura TaxID=69820 RepID=A0A9J7E0N5_SPOLT|nr:pickpocket protein 11-like [Spodoptera litura]
MFGVAVDFYVHSPYDVMDLSVGWTDIILTLVRTTELSVMESRCGRGVKDLSPSRRGCSYMDEPRLSGRKVHSTNTCRLACRSNLAKELCNCVPFYYFYDGGPPCTPKGMWCLANNAHKLLRNNDKKCSCVPQCIDCNYKEMTVEEQVWGNPPFNLHGSIKYSVQAPQTRYTREIVFHFQDLVVSFGGAAGLFLGASFISFVEILYFIVARLFTHIHGAQDINKNKATVVAVKEAAVSHETLRIQYLTAILMEDQKKYDSKPGSYSYYN